MAGATAATAAAGVTQSHANLITVNLTNNYISAAGIDSGVNHLNADVTGDGHADLTIANAFNSARPVSYPTPGLTYSDLLARVNLNGIYARGFFGGISAFTYARLGSRRSSSFGPAISLMGSIPIFFKDLHINGGAPTSGSLVVTVGAASIDLDSFTYTSNTPDQRVNSIPDQGSTLALLAMGAGGVLALRRWRAAQERS